MRYAGRDRVRVAVCAVAGSAEDSGEAVHPDGHGVCGHAGAADDHSAAAFLREDAGRLGSQLAGDALWDRPDHRFHRFRLHRRPTVERADVGPVFRSRGTAAPLLIALGASAIAYLIFGFAHSLLVLFLSRLVQGAGGGTVGVIQAYVADSTDPKDRARALGWLSATTNLGVALGPVLGSFAITLGKRDLMPGTGTLQMGHAAPGIMAAALCLLNMVFVARYLKESRDFSEQRKRRETTHFATGNLARDLACERTFVASDLDLCDRDRRLSGKLFRARAFS